MPIRFEYNPTNVIFEDDSVIVRGTTWLAQNFLIGTRGRNYQHELTNIKLYMRRTGTTGDVTISIRSAPGGVITGSDIVSSTVNGNLISTSNEWVNFDFTTPTNLSESTIYAIIIRAPDASNDLIVLSDASTYPGGGGDVIVQSTNSGGSWTIGLEVSTYFQEFGNVSNKNFSASNIKFGA